MSNQRLWFQFSIKSMLFAMTLAGFMVAGIIRGLTHESRTVKNDVIPWLPHDFDSLNEPESK